MSFYFSRQQLSGTVLTTSSNGTGFYGNQAVSIMESDPNGIGFRDNRFGTPATVWHSTDGNALGSLYYTYLITKYVVQNKHLYFVNEKLSSLENVNRMLSYHFALFQISTNLLMPRKNTSMHYIIIFGFILIRHFFSQQVGRPSLKHPNRSTLASKSN